MTAPDVHVGDKVRITYTYEGHVADTDPDWILLRCSQHKVRRVAEVDGDLQAVTVEVLERAMPKVGDVVKGADLDQLAPYSVAVRCGHAGLALQKLRQGWCLVDAPGDDPVRPLPDRDYRVLYIPEDGAE